MTLSYCAMNRPQDYMSEPTHVDTPLHQTKGFLTPFQRKSLEKHLATQPLNRVHRLRIQIMLLGDEGKSQTEICRKLRCSQATARQWLLMARLGESHRWKEIAIGRPRQISEEYLARLRELVEHGPRVYGYSFRNWTGEWLSKHLFQEFGIKLSARHVNRLLKNMGLSTRSTPKPKSPLVESNPPEVISEGEINNPVNLDVEP